MIAGLFSVNTGSAISSSGEEAAATAGNTPSRVLSQALSASSRLRAESLKENSASPSSALSVTAVCGAAGVAGTAVAAVAPMALPTGTLACSTGISTDAGAAGAMTLPVKRS